MALIVEAAPVGAVIYDSLPFSIGGTASGAAQIKASGAAGVAIYLGSCTPALLRAIFATGLGAFPVTVGNAFNGDEAVALIRALGFPVGVHCFLDVEGDEIMPPGPQNPEPGMATDVLIASIDAWCGKVAAAEFIPAHYGGNPQPLTSGELWGLASKGYWKGGGSCRDRNNALAEPLRCGWMLTQLTPSVQRGGYLVDANAAGEDYLGRSLMWAREV
jgi:hypothetical protein